jgi:hypothetical protein
MDTFITMGLGLGALLWAGELLVACAAIADFYGAKIAKPIAFEEHQRRIANANTIAVPAISALFAGFMINISSSYIADSPHSIANQYVGFGYFLLAMVVLVAPIAVFLRDSTELDEVATTPTTITWAANSYSVKNDPSGAPLGVLTKNLEAWEEKRLRYTFGKRPRPRATGRIPRGIEALRAAALKVEPALDESQSRNTPPFSNSKNIHLPGLWKSIFRTSIPVSRVHATIFPIRTIVAVAPALVPFAFIVVVAPKPGADFPRIMLYSIVLLVVLAITLFPAVIYFAIVSATATRTYVRDARTLLDAYSALRRLEGKVRAGVKATNLAESRSRGRDTRDALLLERLKQLESSLHSLPRDREDCDCSRHARARTLLKDTQKFTKRRRRLSRSNKTGR